MSIDSTDDRSAEAASATAGSISGGALDVGADVVGVEVVGVDVVGVEVEGVEDDVCGVLDRLDEWGGFTGAGDGLLGSSPSDATAQTARMTRTIAATTTRAISPRLVFSWSSGGVGAAAGGGPAWAGMTAVWAGPPAASASSRRRTASASGGRAAGSLASIEAT